MAPAGTLSLHWTRGTDGAEIRGCILLVAVSQLPRSISPVPIATETTGNRSTIWTGPFSGNQNLIRSVLRMNGNPLAMHQNQQNSRSNRIHHSIMNTKGILWPARMSRQFRKLDASSSRIPERLDRSRL